MATVTILLNERYQSKDNTFPIIIRVDHQGQRRKIAVGYKVGKKYWAGSSVSGRHPDAALINASISNKVADINHYLADCKLHGKPIKMELIGSGRLSYSFTEYLLHRAAQYKAAGKIIMDRKVRRWALEVLAVGGGNVYFEDLTPDFLRRLELQMIEAGNVENTRFKKFKFLHQFYAKAILEGKAQLPNPFAEHKIPVKPVKKDKLTGAQIKALEELQLPPGELNNARNLFLFAFYAKGQRFEVCVTLRWDQVKDGRIFFRTNKGNEYISVKIHQRLQAILDQYPDKGKGLIFPYIAILPADKEKYINLVGSKNALVNLALKVVGASVGAPRLKFHDARHSFAYQLKQVTADLNVVQDSLGHSSQQVTKVYLRALEDERLDSEMEKLYGV
jgi:integrase/recombinase XerD